MNTSRLSGGSLMTRGGPLSGTAQGSHYGKISLKESVIGLVRQSRDVRYVQDWDCGHPPTFCAPLVVSQDDLENWLLGKRIFRSRNRSLYLSSNSSACECGHANKSNAAHQRSDRNRCSGCARMLGSRSHPPWARLTSSLY